MQYPLSKGLDFVPLPVCRTPSRLGSAGSGCWAGWPWVGQGAHSRERQECGSGRLHRGGCIVQGTAIARSTAFETTGEEDRAGGQRRESRTPAVHCHHVGEQAGGLELRGAQAAGRAARELAGRELAGNTVDVEHHQLLGLVCTQLAEGEALLQGSRCCGPAAYTQARPALPALAGPTPSIHPACRPAGQHAPRTCCCPAPALPHRLPGAAEHGKQPGCKNTEQQARIPLLTRKLQLHLMQQAQQLSGGPGKCCFRAQEVHAHNGQTCRRGTHA